jgi:hypothetical protein
MTMPRPGRRASSQTHDSAVPSPIMPSKKPTHNRWFAVATAVALVLALALPVPVAADGGPVLSDPQLWALLKEGQQTAVISLGSGNSAYVDLFVTMLDQSGQSHQVTFFVPLGKNAAQFRTVEETSREFDESVTEPLDAILRAEVERQAGYKTSVRGSLLLGTLLINGGWSWPIWLLGLLSGCGVAGVPAPIATYETASSQVSIYGVDEDTDLQMLIQTTGLSPAVQETLSRLRGQQVAIVTLQTQPSPAGGSPGGGPTGQPGLHLSWQSTFATGSAQASYAYPLGTGSAWAHPIELTRIYVASPPGLDFVTEYPELGENLSGYTAGGWSSRSAPRIQQATGAAYAVDEAVDAMHGRVWRVTYMQSNSAEDLIITSLPTLSPRTLGALQLQRRQGMAGALSWLFAPLAALAVWLVVWRYVMGRLLKVKYRWGERRFWLDALGWALLYPLTNGIILVSGVVFVALTAGLGAFIAAPILFVTLLGGVSIFLFARIRAQALGVSWRRAAVAYIATVLVANGLFFSFGLLYLALLGA